MSNDDLPSSHDDSRLAAIVEEMTDLISAGQLTEVDRLLEQHPRDAERLQGTLETLKTLGLLNWEQAYEHSADREVHDSAERQPSAMRPADGIDPAVSQEVTPGILGDFRIVREIGRGGMGVVYEAEQISLRRRVALKVLPLASLLDERALTRFHNEAQAAASLHHPHIVPVYSVGCERGVHYYAMHYIEGVSLDRAIKQIRARSVGAQPDVDTETTLGVDQDLTGTSDVEAALLRSFSTERAQDPSAYYRSVASLGADAADALHYAHERGIIHRDIKPGNLLLDAHRRLWIADFGLARIDGQSDLTITGDLLGTLRYMSPEHAAGDRLIVDQRSDIYSLGATLFEAITGRPVFAGNDRGKILKQIAEASPQPIREIDPQVPFDLETIILKTLAKAPSDRYASALHLSADLRRFISKLPIHARRPTLWQRVKRLGRAHSDVMLAACGGLLIAVAIAITSSAFIWRAHRAASAALSRSTQSLLIAEDRERYARQHMYVADITAAHLAGLRDDKAEMHRLLKTHSPLKAAPDSPGFEWYYLWRLSHMESLSLPMRDAQAYCLDFSPSSRLLAAGYSDGHICLWSIPQGQLVREFSGHSGDVNTVRFFHDGHRLLSASGDGSARVWDCDTGRTLHTLRGHEGEVTHAFLSPGRNMIATGGADGKVCFWNADTFGLMRSFVAHKDRIRGLAFSSDGRRIFTATTDGAVLGWNVDTGAAELELQRELSGSIMSISLSHDDKILVAGHFFQPDKLRQGGLSFWEIPQATGIVRPVSQQVYNEGGHSVEFFRNRHAVVSMSHSGRLRIWEYSQDKRAPRLNSELVRHDSAVWCAQLSPDERWLASSTRANDIKIAPVTFDATKVMRIPDLSIGVRGLSLARDVDCFSVWLEDGQFHTYRFNSHLELEKVGSSKVQLRPTTRILLSPNKQWVASFDGTKSYISAVAEQPNTRTSVRVLPYSEVAFTADNRYFAGVEHDGISYSDFATGRTVRFLSCQHVSCCEISPDGQWLLAGTGDGCCHLWDLKQGFTHSVFRCEQKEPITALEFSRDGVRFATGTAEGSVKLWSTQPLEEIRGLDSDSMRRSGPKAVNALAFSADGRTLAVGRDEPFMRLWNIETGRELLAFKPLSQLSIEHVAFSPDGKRLVALGLAEPYPSRQIAIWSLE